MARPPPARSAWPRCRHHQSFGLPSLRPPSWLSARGARRWAWAVAMLRAGGTIVAAGAVVVALVAAIEAERSADMDWLMGLILVGLHYASTLPGLLLPYGVCMVLRGRPDTPWVLPSLVAGAVYPLYLYALAHLCETIGFNGEWFDLFESVTGWLIVGLITFVPGTFLSIAAARLETRLCEQCRRS